MLLISVCLREGIICVALVAPLVYGIAHGMAELARWSAERSNRLALLPIPLLLLAGSVEGSTERMRISPIQTVHIVRTIAENAETVAHRLAEGPRPVAANSLVLRALAVPLPQHVTGEGLAVGDRWTFHYGHDSHGPGGATVVRVTASEPGRLAFGFETDTTITARWFAWHHATLTWVRTGSGRLRVDLSITTSAVSTRPGTSVRYNRR